MRRYTDIGPAVAPARGTAAFVLACLLLACFVVLPAAAQAPRFTMAVRGVDLGEALATFANTTGVALAYDPALVRGARAYCAATDATPEEILRCLLADSGLDFYRLSSGTYVLARRVELAPRPGYLAGTVVDRETGAPLAYAHVYLHNSGHGSVTNDAGHFVFPELLPGPYDVSVTYVGYEPWRDTVVVAPQVRTEAEARLAPEPVLITPVVVDGLQERVPSEALVHGQVTAGALRDGPVRGGLQPLGALPGVRINDVTAGLHLQGGDGGAHQFRLDGAPVFMPRNLVGFVGPFNAFAVDRITVHKAGFGAALGSHLAGVVAAEHAVDGAGTADAQIDPLSFNARLRRTFGDGGAPTLALMAAGRVGLWGVYHPAPLARTLNAWTAPDLFLLGASLGDVPGDALDGSPASEQVRSAFDGLPPLQSTADPELRFSDLHLAGRLRLSPLRTLHASLYRGRSRLGGGILSGSSDAFSPTFQPALTVVDDYDWANTVGQVRYSAVLGARTLVAFQARGSRYDLVHEYDVVNALSFNVPVTGAAAPALSSFGTVRVRDGNAVRILAAEASVDHARGRHHARLGAEVSHVDSRFGLLYVNLPSGVDWEEMGTAGDGRFHAENAPQPVTNRSGQWWLATYAEDEVTLGRRWTADAGVRLTYRPERATVYAEPRLAVRYDHPGGRLSTRTAAGLYRQFINEFDVSKLNPGALLPEVRIWLPLDASVRPPLAYHAAQSLLVTPRPGLALRAEAYYKYQPHGLAVRYRPGTSPGPGTEVRSQAQILASTTGYAAGVGVSAEQKGRHGRLYALYEYSRARRRSPDLFGGRTETVPWNEPHRVELSATWTPAPALALSARWQGVWGRAWGFRQAYYDYLGHTDSTRYRGDVDLGSPSDHVLPALLQLDLGAAYTRRVGAATLQLRLDVLNVFDRTNVADWRLVRDASDLHTEARPLYPRIPSAAVRLSF